MVVGGSDVRDPCQARSLDEACHRGNDTFSVRNRELSVGVDEVDLRVDIPEDALHETSSSLGLGRYRRPTFADGLPSVSTMSPVKSLEPRISDEPTP